MCEKCKKFRYVLKFETIIDIFRQKNIDCQTDEGIADFLRYFCLKSEHFDYITAAEKCSLEETDEHYDKYKDVFGRVYACLFPDEMRNLFAEHFSHDQIKSGIIFLLKNDIPELNKPVRIKEMINFWIEDDSEKKNFTKSDRFQSAIKVFIEKCFVKARRVKGFNNREIVRYLGIEPKRQGGELMVAGLKIADRIERVNPRLNNLNQVLEWFNAYCKDNEFFCKEIIKLVIEIFQNRDLEIFESDIDFVIAIAKKSSYKVGGVGFEKYIKDLMLYLANTCLEKNNNYDDENETVRHIHFYTNHNKIGPAEMDMLENNIKMQTYYEYNKEVFAEKKYV